jgi:hypothetical protein
MSVFGPPTKSPRIWHGGRDIRSWFLSNASARITINYEQRERQDGDEQPNGLPFSCRKRVAELEALAGYGPARRMTTRHFGITVLEHACDILRDFVAQG